MKEFRKAIYREAQIIIIPPLECFQADVTISSVAAEASDDGTVWLTYTNCAGDIVNYQFADAGFYSNALCVSPETGEAFYYYVDSEAINATGCELEITITPCGE